MPRPPIDGPYSFSLDSRTGWLHLTPNFDRMVKAGSFGAHLHAILEVIAGMTLRVARNLWVVAILFVLVSKTADLADLPVLLALAYGCRRFVDLLTQPTLVNQFGQPFEYVFSHDALTIKVGPRQWSASDSYYLPYADLAVFYVDTLAPGGHIAFQVLSRSESDSFNKWLSYVATLRETSMGDIAMIGREIDKWLTCPRKEFSTKKLQAAIQAEPDELSA